MAALRFGFGFGLGLLVVGACDDGLADVVVGFG